LGQLKKHIDPQGGETEFIYDAQHRLITLIRPGDTPASARPEQHFAYNAVGQLQSTTDPLGVVTEYFYDDRGRLLSTLYADGTLDKSVYGTAGYGKGLLIKSIDRLGVISNYEYDQAVRLIAKHSAVARMVSGSEIASPETAWSEHWSYLIGTNDEIDHRRGAARVQTVYDYRGRVVLDQVRRRLRRIHASFCRLCHIRYTVLCDNVRHALLHGSVVARLRSQCDPRRNGIEVNIGTHRKQRFLIEDRDRFVPTFEKRAHTLFRPIDHSRQGFFQALHEPAKIPQPLPSRLDPLRVFNPLSNQRLQQFARQRNATGGARRKEPKPPAYDFFIGPTGSHI
jgi:YD repeat-containing protein